jgi:hypothetical protein
MGRLIITFILLLNANGHCGYPFEGAVVTADMVSTLEQRVQMLQSGFSPYRYAVSQRALAFKHTSRDEGRNSPEWDN